MKKLYLLFVTLCITAGTWAYDFKVDGIFYSITSSTSPYTAAVTVETSSANSYSGTVTIPSTVTFNGISYSVTSIGTYAFYASVGLTSVSIPSSVTLIDSWAFLSCTGLTALSIPVSVTTIGDGVFWGCTNIAAINIPASVKKIGSYVFFGNWALTQINADAANTNYSSANGVLYNKDKSTLLVYPAGKPEASYTIASTVDSVGSFVFGYCKNLTSVTIPTNVVYMSSSVFYECNGLTNVFIPASVTFLNNNPFNDCKGLAAVTVDPANQYNASVDGVLFNKNLTTFIYYPPAKTGTGYVIPSTVTYVRSSAFMNCISLNSITIPSSVGIIRSGAFSGCTGLSTLNAYRPTPVDLTSVTIDESRNVFTGVDTTTCVLHVPVGSKNLYASTFQWKGFSHIVEGFTSGFSLDKNTDFKVSIEKGHLQVSGVEMGEMITVYNLQGVAMYSQPALVTNTIINLNLHGMYLVNVGGKSVKMIL